MRLTLRTLLAYLDDTLDPVQARQIGDKVAESTVAQELIEKIRRVARKRGITIPTATGPESADPNLVAEYLDNDLAPDKVNEIEEQALHSDVHLAEIAACHQLLTLIMTEPAKVPPMSRQRMYNLVKGPEADAGRIVPRVAPATLAEIESPDDADTSVLVSRRGGRTRLWVAGVLALGLIGAVWQAMRHPVEETTRPPTAPVVADNQPKPKVDDTPKAIDKPVEKPADPPKEMAIGKAADSKPPIAVPPIPDELASARKPSSDNGQVGKTAGIGTLLQRASDEGQWKRVPANSVIVGGTRLLSLPGMANEVRFGDAIVELFGTMSDIHQVPMFESATTVYTPVDGIAADVRLDRGRIYMKSAKPTGVKVRVRLGDDLFDVAFADDKSEVLVERTSIPDGVPFSRDRTKQLAPVALGGLAVTQGQASVTWNLKKSATLVAGPKPTMWRWGSNGAAESPTELSEPSPLWVRMPNLTGPDRVAAVDMEQTVKRMKQFYDASKLVNVAIAEVFQDRSRAQRRFGVFCLAAMDDFDILDKLEDPTNPDQRQAAMLAIHHWLGRSADRAGNLFNELIKQRHFSEAEAEAALTMWFGYSDADLNDSKTYSNVLDALNGDKLAVRELAHWRLATRLDQEGARLIRYAATDPADARQRAIQDWKRRIPDGQLPPGRMK